MVMLCRWLGYNMVIAKGQGLVTHDAGGREWTDVLTGELPTMSSIVRGTCTSRIRRGHHAHDWQ